MKHRRNTTAALLRATHSTPAPSHARTSGSNPEGGGRPRFGGAGDCDGNGEWVGPGESSLLLHHGTDVLQNENTRERGGEGGAETTSERGVPIMTDAEARAATAAQQGCCIYDDPNLAGGGMRALSTRCGRAGALALRAGPFPAAPRPAPPPPPAPLSSISSTWPERGGGQVLSETHSERIITHACSRCGVPRLLA